MSEICAIFGAGGHGKVIGELAELNGYAKVVFFDDRWPALRSIEHWLVVGDSEQLLKSDDDYDCIVAIGNNQCRLQKLALLKSIGFNIITLVHPSASISEYSALGTGSVIMANATVNPFTTIGEGVIVNTTSSIDHDCYLADGVHIAPGANIAGGVKIGSASWVGIGSQINQGLSIGSDVVIGAGSSVLENISDSQTVVGSPAKAIVKK